ncbi:unannotated protein [freshwater metagenome]|uniref:Unannotated protein n=1 Tax=freshwater metagenome TaxID=449393 RepID=A0A6J6JHJ8_9ZZZZ|nr:hypothetical protein [Actinomycetota bacterium]
MSPKQNGSSVPEGEALATFTDYKQAVAFIEKMIENDFPPKLVSIVGTDLKTVESIKGKLGYGRVSISGAITGSWLGLFFGLIFGTTGTGTEAALMTNVTAGIVIGAGVGMLINIIRFSLTKNRRGFISGQTVVAKQYEVVVPAEQLQLAKKAASNKALKSPKPAKKSS